MKLAHLLEPIAVADFFAEYFGERPVLAPGPSGRFCALVPAGGEHDTPAIELARNLERDLEAPVRAEPVGDWPGLILQRMECDTIVLQTAGDDRWSFYGRDPEAAAEPCWESLLEAGGMLYIPRGYWCEASPRNGPSSNRILKVHNPTGADLLAWFASLLKEYEAFQTDVPRFASPARQAAYLTALRKATARAYRAPSLMEAFNRRRNNFAPRYSPAETGELTDGCCVDWAAPRYPKIRRLDPETICLRHDGREIRFPLDAAPLLQYLFDKLPIAVTEFYRYFETGFDRAELSDLLLALAGDGIVRFLMPLAGN